MRILMCDVTLYLPSERCKGCDGKSKNPNDPRRHHDKPDSVHGRLRGVVNFLPPAGTRKSIVSGKSENHAGCINALGSSSDELNIRLAQVPLQKRNVYLNHDDE